MNNGIESWTISGAKGEPILGDCHTPDGKPRGVVLIAHGFLGYKDYGMFPRIAQQFAANGYVAHRFNFSHSGMTNEFETFARPELFARDTWNKQVFDLRSVIEAVGDGRLVGTGVPLILFGHSRGGVTVLLTAGRYADDKSFLNPAGVITAAAPSVCNRLDKQREEQLLNDGYMIQTSSRTSQDLRINRGWLDEQRAEPERHDVQRQVSRIRCPMLFVHGDDDPTVPAADADELHASAAENAEVAKIDGANHVFNTPNPLPAQEPSSRQLTQLIDAAIDFLTRVTGE